MKKGDIVIWESQSRSCRTQKTGVIVEAVAPFDGTRLNHLRQKYTKTHQLMFDGRARDHESYMVEVHSGKTDKAKPKLYWPRVCLLREVKDG